MNRQLGMWTSFRKQLSLSNTSTDIKFPLSSISPEQNLIPLPPYENPRGKGVRKWPICSKADSTNTRVRPKGRGLLPVVPSQPVKTSGDGFFLL